MGISERHPAMAAVDPFRPGRFIILRGVRSCQPRQCLAVIPRQEKGDETYRREYMCEFGDMEGAVFSRESIDAAFQDFEPLNL